MPISMSDLSSVQSEKKQFSPLVFNSIRSALVIFLLTLWSLFMTSVFFISLLIPFYDSQRLSIIFHSGFCFLFGIEVIVEGEISQTKPTLFVSNHVSYLDIFALGKKVPGSFVAKTEVAGWPVLNKFAKMQNTVFVERKAGKAKQQVQQLRECFENNINLILFPEGTSTNGVEVLPLKSSLFAAAESDKVDVLVQPVSIVYTQYNGKGMNQDQRDNFAWYADMPFGSHFLKMTGLGKVQAVVTFDKPIALSECENRKECAQLSEDAMRKSFTHAFDASGSVK
jgi:1-acyl-sn-glycerol-3-phosphate acyltransferase